MMVESMRDINEEIYQPVLRSEEDLLKYVKRTPMPVSAQALYRWHTRPGAFERLRPPWQYVEVEALEGIRNGDLTRLKVGFGPLKLDWHARHGPTQPGRSFSDEQIRGPFDTWRHVHRMIPDGENRSVLEDEVSFALPFHELTHRLFDRKARKEIDALFTYRHRLTRHDLTRHLTYATRPLRVAVTGSSGLIGSALTAFLTTGGHEVVKLVRRRGNLEPGEFYWNPDTTEIELAGLEGVDAVVHLGGASLFQFPLTKEKMEQVRVSRERGTLLLASSLTRLETPPSVLVSASGVGFYGARGDQPVSESDEAGSGYLADICRLWEAATEPASAAGIRVAHARIGIVVDPRSPAMKKILPFFRYGLGGQLSTGPDWISWVALDDVLGGIYHAIFKEDVEGPFNLNSPKPVTMKEFTETLGQVIHRPVWLTVPTSLARRLGGRFLDEILLSSARVVPERLQGSNFTFAFPNLESAFRHTLGRAA